MLSPLSKISIFILSLSLLCLSACRYFKADSTIKVRVINAIGEPISNAQIMIQKQNYALTDVEGLATIHTELPVNEPLFVEVTKSSPNFFYAPYFETIQLKRGENNIFQIRATLFGISKDSSSTNSADEPKATHIESTDTPVEPAPETLNTDKTFSLSPNPPSIENYSSLTPQNSEPGTSDSSTPEPTRIADNQNRLITLYIESGGQPVVNASVFYGDPDRSQWLEGCTSNTRGRCSLSLPNYFSANSVSLLLRAQGFVTQAQSVAFAQGDRFRFDLNRGNSLDVFAIQRQYNNSIGLKGIKILIDDKEIGKTDAFGFFSQALNTTTRADTSLKMLSSSHIPQEVSRKISLSEPVTLIQNFELLEAPHARVFLLPLMQSGTQVTPEQLTWEEKIVLGLRQYLLNTSPFEEADIERISPLLNRLDISPKMLGKKGWQNNELLNEFEYALRPVIIEAPQPTLELSLIDSRGEVIAAAKTLLPGQKSEDATLASMLRKLGQDIAIHVPFEGAIIEAVKDGFYINLGAQRGYALSSGAKLDIFGTLNDPSGQKNTWTDLGSATVREVGARRSKIRIDELKPRATAGLGQIVRLQRQPLKVADEVSFGVTDAYSKQPLSQANIYVNDQWLASTDTKGIGKIPRPIVERRSTLLIIKAGYRPWSEEFGSYNKQQHTVQMQRDGSTLRIESIPDQAQVKLNGRILGNTPIYRTIEAISAEVPLEIQFEGYRTYSKMIHFDEDGLDLTGEKSIKLEKDPIREAHLLVDQGRLQEAVDFLEALPQSHPDILPALHELGEIYLNKLQDPVKASVAFHRVTSRPEIANFSDKRFIGTHINEAVALYHAGEKLSSTDPTAATNYWKEAIEEFNNTEGQLRYVPQDRYLQALHSLYYYRAISLQRSWALTQQPDLLQSAHEAWKSYIENTTLSTPADRNYALLKKAETFYKQTQILLQSGEPETAQKSSSDQNSRSL